MEGKRVGQRVHADIEGAACRRERLLGLQDDGKFRQIVAADPHERTCAALARDGAGMRESIAHLPQRNNIVRRWHIQGAGGSQCMQGHGGTTPDADRSEEHTSELQSLMRISYAVFCLKKKKT